MGRVDEFFQPNSSWWVKKYPTHHRGSTQPNPRGSGWVGLDPWVGQYFLITIIIIIIIKLSIRITLPQIKSIYNQIIMSITPNKYKLYETNLKFGFYLGREAKK